MTGIASVFVYWFDPSQALLVYSKNRQYKDTHQLTDDRVKLVCAVREDGKNPNMQQTMPPSKYST